MESCRNCINYGYCDDEEKSTICEAFETDRFSKQRRLTPYERTKAQVYATGNKWAIENFHATHN